MNFIEFTNIESRKSMCGLENCDDRLFKQ